MYERQQQVYTEATVRSSSKFFSPPSPPCYILQIHIQWWGDTVRLNRPPLVSSVACISLCKLTRVQRARHGMAPAQMTRTDCSLSAALCEEEKE